MPEIMPGSSFGLVIPPQVLEAGPVVALAYAREEILTMWGAWTVSAEPRGHLILLARQVDVLLSGQRETAYGFTVVRNAWAADVETADGGTATTADLVLRRVIDGSLWEVKEIDVHGSGDWRFTYAGSGQP